MTIRKFRPGDKVQKKGEGPTMIVQKYCLTSDVFGETYLSDKEVECVWYENGKRKSETFDQRTLTKVTNLSTDLHSLFE